MKNQSSRTSEALELESLDLAKQLAFNQVILRIRAADLESNANRGLHLLRDSLVTVLDTDTNGSRVSLSGFAIEYRVWSTGMPLILTFKAVSEAIEAIRYLDRVNLFSA